METIRLRGWETFAEGQESIRALLFGVLADLAWPIVEHYRSDLFHDARWIAEYVTGPIGFYFRAGQYGTSIGTDCDSLTSSRDSDRLWSISLRCEGSDPTAEGGPEHWKARGLWVADVEEIAFANAADR